MSRSHNIKISHVCISIHLFVERVRFWHLDSLFRPIRFHFITLAEILRATNTFWNRPSTATPVQPAMELATPRIVDISHWLSSNKHVKIGLAVALPSVILLLSTTPITDKLAQAWRRAIGKTSPTEDTAHSERVEPDTNDKPPELPKKSYGQLPPRKRAARPEHNEQGMSKDNILFNNVGPESPKKSYAAAAASAQPLPPLTPDSASINSESSSEQSRKHKFRLGENIKKRWQNRPFGHGSSESPLSP